MRDAPGPLKPGDLAEVVSSMEYPCAQLAPLLGHVGRVESTPQAAPGIPDNAYCFSDAVLIEFDNERQWLATCYLRKVPPDCDEPARWTDEGVWRPAGVVA